MSWRGALLVLAVAPWIIGFPHTLSAQSGSPNPAVITSQLQAASRVGRQALEGLKALPPDDAVPIDPEVLKKARETYGLIRAARHGMELKKQADRFPDPTLAVAFKRVDEAFNLARIPVDKASWGINRSEYLRLSIPSLSRALRLVDQALVILP